MSRTIADLTEGTIIWINEYSNNVATLTPYIYLGLDESGNARIMRKIAAVAKRMNATNVASYAGCEMDVWLEDSESGFLSRFDATTRNAFTNTSISYADYTLSGNNTPQRVTIVRRCFPLSYTEEGWAATAVGSEGRSYLPALKAVYLAEHPDETAVADNTARIGYGTTGNAVVVWMRSAYSATDFRYVHANGYAVSSYASNANDWVRPALSVAPATIVSDEGADVILLIPGGRTAYWGINAEMSLGTTTARPKKAKLLVDISEGFNSKEIQICNNYGDTTPTWFPIQPGGIATLGTVKTAQNWELGLKMDLRGSNANLYVGEPALVVEMDEE